MKKIITLVLSTLMVFTLAACGEVANTEDISTPSAESTNTEGSLADKNIDEEPSELPDSIETTAQEEPKSKYDTFTYYVTLPEKSDDISGTLEEKYNEHFAAHIGSYDDYDTFWDNLSSTYLTCPFCVLDLAHFENHESSIVCVEKYHTEQCQLPYDGMRLTVVGNTIVFEHNFYESLDVLYAAFVEGDTTINPYWEYFYQENNYQDAISYFYNILIGIYYYENIIPDNYTVLLNYCPGDEATVFLSTNTSAVETLESSHGIDYCSWWNENKDTYSGEKERIGNELFEYYSVQ